jgi:3-dehydroquinate dehydratase / shikimate dehydrogenase
VGEYAVSGYRRIAEMSKPLVCVTVTAPTTAELRRRRDDVADADLIELRLDSVSDPDAAGALAGRRRPVIITCRPEWEGGWFKGAEEDRRRILADALALGAEYVDIESRARFDDLVSQSRGRRVVLSYHDFDGIPADLAGRVQAMRSTGAEVVKVAVRTERLSECLPLLDLGAQMCQSGFVAIAMGPAGLATRVLAGRFGSMWTYAGSQREVGQVSADTLLNEYRFRSLTDTTDVYGLVGWPVSHSVSPAMHNATFAATRIDAVYLPLPAVSADDFLTFARAIGVKGVSVTIPHKITLFDRVDEIDAVARRIGAINTIRVTDGRWLGSNTDVEGFLQPLVTRVELNGLRASILGSGGAARAVAVALSSSGCRVRVHARNRQHAEEAAAVTSAEVGPYPPERGSWDLLVNCTPVGMYPRIDESPVDAADLTGTYVYDLVYNPTGTRLLRDAARAGCQTIGGLEMLVAQAHEQFYWWTGVHPPAGVMREAALKRLAEFIRDENYVA